MSHEIDFTKNRPAIAYAGAKPWHGFGEQLDPADDLEKWLVAAGLDYSVLERAVGFQQPWFGDDLGPKDVIRNADFERIAGKKVLLRNDTMKPLSVVSNRYKPVQPKDVLYFFEDLVSDMGFKMHTAGALNDGKKVWALAETGKEANFNGVDRVGAYLLLATSYDGQFSTTAQFTSIRVVCNNTLSFSLAAGERQQSGIVRIPHVSDFGAEQVKAELGLLGPAWNEFQNNVTRLIDHRVTKRRAVEFFLELMGVTEEEAADGKQLQNVKKLVAFYESAPGSQLPTAKDTAWGLVNAVTYFTDHGRRAHNAGTRFNSASFGDSSILKRQAFSKALELTREAA